MKFPSSGRTWTALLIWMVCGAALAVLAILLYAPQQEARWSTVATGIVVTAAAMLAGGVVGFVFGVPRAATADAAGGGAAGAAGARRLPGIVGNTNLEQISDWLTKILVGVGLTQFGSIADGAGRIIGSVAPALGDGKGASVFTGGLMIFSTAFGFITGWLYTRLLLGSAMADADRRATARTLIEAADQEQRAGNDDAARSLRERAVDVLDGKPLPEAGAAPQPAGAASGTPGGATAEERQTV